jgi:hypothetical protein
LGAADAESAFALFLVLAAEVLAVAEESFELVAYVPL